MVASFIDDSKLLCVSPPVFAAGIALMRDGDHVSWERSLAHTRRDTRLLESSGFLRLSIPMFWRGLQIPYWARDSSVDARFSVSAAFRDFALSLYVNISSREVDGGESLNICAGQHATAQLPSRVPLDGFCVNAENVNRSTIVLEQSGARLAEASLVLNRDLWQRVEVAVTAEHVAVTYDGVPVVSGTRLHHWSPTIAFQIGVVNRKSAVLLEEYSRWLAGARVIAGSLVRASGAEVEVSLNAQEYTHDHVRYIYLPEPHVRTIHPLSGPTEGGTLVELGVQAQAALANSSDHMCHFHVITMANATATVATWDGLQQLLRCRTPAIARAGRTETTVSMRLNDYTLASGDGVVYTFYSVATIGRVQPGTGPMTGETDISIRGTGFAAGAGPFRCRFNRTEMQPATLELRSQTMRCRSPLSEAGTELVEVSLNGQQYHGELETSSFAVYAPPRVLSLSPASGTVLGQTMVTIAGSNFERSFNNLCRWGNLTTNVSTINATHIVCPTPVRPSGMSLVEVTLNGQQYTADGRNFSHYLHPHVRMLSLPGELGTPGTFIASKTTLPQAGYVMVSIWGTGFMGGTDYRCKINEHEPIEATYDARSDAIKCWSDLWIDGTNYVEVTLNGREYTSDGASIEINQFWFDERYNSPTQYRSSDEAGLVRRVT